MRRRGRRIETSPSLIITSMIDMFTFILVFLITFLDPNQSAATDDFTVPTARGETPGQTGDDVHLQVSPRAVRIDGTEVVTLDENGPDVAALETVREALAARAPADPTDPGAPNTPLIVEVDRKVAWSALSPTLAAAERAGFSDFRFVVVQEEE